MYTWCCLLNQGDERGPWNDQRSITECFLGKGQSFNRPESTPYSFTWDINSHLNGRKLLGWLIHWGIWNYNCSQPHACVCGWYNIEEMCGGIMPPITEMGCKYGPDSQSSDVPSAHFIWDCSAGAKWQPVPHRMRGKLNLVFTVL